MTFYMVTIHKSRVKDYVSEEDLIEILKCLSTGCDIIEYAFEMHGVYRQLHCHAIVMLPKDTWYSSKIRGFRLYWSKLYDYKKTLLYVQKNASNKYLQDQICAENQYKLYRFT